MNLQPLPFLAAALTAVYHRSGADGLHANLTGDREEHAIKEEFAAGTAAWPIPQLLGRHVSPATAAPTAT